LEDMDRQRETERERVGDEKRLTDVKIKRL
jgi:hypothetical protein